MTRMCGCHRLGAHDAADFRRDRPAGQISRVPAADGKVADTGRPGEPPAQLRRRNQQRDHQRRRRLDHPHPTSEPLCAELRPPNRYPDGMYEQPVVDWMGTIAQGPVQAIVLS
jgi:hypothetical protein